MQFTNLKYLFVSVLYIVVSCTNSDKTADDVEQNTNVVNRGNKSWMNSNMIFQEEGAKIGEPSLIKYNNKYHLFYSSDSNDTPDNTGIFYTTSNSLDQLNSSGRYNLFGDGVYSPQVFYFTPRKQWYLFADSKTENNPVFATNSNIENVRGWSELRKMNLGVPVDKSYIIADSANVYMFYSTAGNKFLYRRTSIDKFPEGLKDSKELKSVINCSYNNNCLGEDIPNIYYSVNEDKYLAFALCRVTETGGDTEVKLFTADSLNGHWTFSDKFNLKASTVYNTDGSLANMNTINNPDIFRAGSNQLMRINGDNMKIIYQTTNNREGKSCTGFSIMMN